jgi:hypothetical protein
MLAERPSWHLLHWQRWTTSALTYFPTMPSCGRFDLLSGQPDSCWTLTPPD